MLAAEIDARITPLMVARATAHRQRVKRGAIDASSASQARGDLVEAHAWLTPFEADSDVALKRSEIRARAVAAVEEEIARIETQVTPDLSRIVERANQFTALLSAVDHSRLRQRTADHARNAASREFGIASEEDAATVRLVRHALRDAVSALETWRIEAGTNPLAGIPKIPARIVGNIDKPCGNNLSLESLRATAATLTGDALNFGSSSPFIELALDVTCKIEFTKGESESLPSVYIVGHQQHVNPEYVQVQARLDAANAQLAQVRLQNALNPPANAWAGAAQGLTVGLWQATVANLTRELANTPPYLSTPIESPYSVRATQYEKRATVTLRVKARDIATGLLDGAEIVVAEAHGDREISGAMATDQNGFRNAEAALAPNGALISGALAKVKDSEATVRGIIERVLLDRALRENGAAQYRRAIGTLLFARDVAPTPGAWGRFAAVFERLDGISRNELATFRPDLPARPSPKVARGASPTAATRPAAGRAAVVAQVLKHVVTVETDRGTRGSGFFVSGTGHLLTNAHVVAGATKVKVTTQGGDVYLVTVVASDSASDLALLKAPGRTEGFLELDRSGPPDVGSDVIAVGSPLGLEGTVTRGIVSALRRRNGVSLLQIDAAINAGNSGGPLVNDSGVVVGITTWKLAGDNAESLGFAVATPAAIALLDEYVPR